MKYLLEMLYQSTGSWKSGCRYSCPIARCKSRSKLVSTEWALDFMPIKHCSDALRANLVIARCNNHFFVCASVAKTNVSINVACTYAHCALTCASIHCKALGTQQKAAGDAAAGHLAEANYTLLDPQPTCSSVKHLKLITHCALTAHFMLNGPACLQGSIRGMCTPSTVYA